MTTATTLPDEPLQAFRDRVRGDILLPDDEGYDQARAVWNGMVDKHPAVIARCTGAADVIAAVGFARENGLPVSVRGGGHNVAGKAVCDHGVMIDLSPMRGVRVDPAAQTAGVQAGAQLGDFDHEAQAHGLATTAGVFSRTGVAGLTLGGGIGFLARRYGMALDNLIGADVVTAEGRLLHASEDEHPDLFWGLRGGGGNFGVVTSFEFRLHEVGPEVMTAQIFHPWASAGDVLRAYRDFMAGAPDEVGCFALIVHVPPEPPFPAEFHGQPAVALVACHSGDVEAGQDALAPLQEMGDAMLEVVQPMRYALLQQSFDGGTPDGERYYFKSQYLAELPDAAIDTVVEHATPLPGAFTAVGFEPMGGAINRVDPTATAFPHRDALFNFGIWAGWSDPADDDEIIAWTREFHEAMTAYSTGGIYANYLDHDEVGRSEAAYRQNYDRLVELKRKWDPDNLFSLNPDLTGDA